MKRRRLSLVVLAACLIGFGMTVRPAAAQDEPEMTLKGLPGVRVSVEDVTADAKRNGLTKDLIQTTVEIQLRLGGIRVLTASEWIRTASAPLLHVQVNTVKADTGIYAYNVDVGLIQAVMLKSGQPALGQTWQEGTIGLVGASKLLEVRESVKEYVDKFINAWLTANPKK